MLTTCKIRHDARAAMLTTCKIRQGLAELEEATVHINRSPYVVRIFWPNNEQSTYLEGVRGR